MYVYVRERKEGGGREAVKWRNGGRRERCEEVAKIDGGVSPRKRFVAAGEILNNKVSVMKTCYSNRFLREV